MPATPSGWFGNLRTLSFCVFLVLVGSLTVGSQTDVLPKISDLKAISYTDTAPNRTSAMPSNRELTSTISLAEAYSRGNQLLPNFREPILTRGASGIAVYRNVSPSVVLVVVGDVKNKEFEPAGLGAGVLVNATGDILTNWHVINGYQAAVIFFKPQGGTEIEKSTAYIARVVLQSEMSDLALLRLVERPPNLPPPVTIGNVSSIQVAEDIHVIGHPKEHLWSYSTGVVSQIRNGYTWSYSDGSKHEAKVLQLQTAINPGNSGGPVVDDQGKLLGLIAMGEEGQNLDYAIAADVIQSFLSTAASRTRGGSGDVSDEARYSLGHLQDGRTVTKATYPNSVEYLVSDRVGKALAFAAETTDGTDVVAWGVNASSGFNDWSIALPNGMSVHARGKAGAPEVFTSK